MRLSLGGKLKYQDQTHIGGTNEAFRTTHWTDIFSVRTDDNEKRRAAMGQLLAGYWKPVYCYLRRKGYDNEEAKDLTQGFLQEIVLGRKLIQQADREKGKFRSFLLTALDNYVTSGYRAETAKKRMPSAGMVPLDTFDSPNIPDPAMTATPHQAFAHAWASTLLDEVLVEVKAVCERTGQKAHWLVFNARVVTPILENVQPPSLSELCRRQNISNVGRASNMVVTVKRQFQKALRTRVRQFVAGESEVAHEIQDLIQILSISRAGT